MANKRKKKIHKKIETVNRKISFMLAKGVEGVKRRGASPESPKNSPVPSIVPDKNHTIPFSTR
jgi:hypothetical protein